MGRLLKGLSKAVEDTAFDKVPLGDAIAIFANKTRQKENQITTKFYLQCMMIIDYIQLFTGWTWKKTTFQNPRGSCICRFAEQPTREILKQNPQTLICIIQFNRTALHIDLNPMAVLKLINLRPL